MEIIVFVGLAFAVVTAIAANARGRNPVAWGALGLIFGVFALVAVLVMKDESKGS